MNSRDLLAGAGAGALLAYLLDVDSGSGRRRRMRETLVRGRRLMREGGDAALVARVQSLLARVCSHPGAIGVRGSNGQITLRGPVLADEADAILSTVASVRGVRVVFSELERHVESDRHPALPGGHRHVGDVPGRSWTPTTGALVAGGLLIGSVGLALYLGRRTRAVPDAFATETYPFDRSGN